MDPEGLPRVLSCPGWPWGTRELLLPAKAPTLALTTVCKAALPSPGHTYKWHLSMAFTLNPAEVSPNWLRKDGVCRQLGLGVGGGRPASTSFGGDQCQ